MRVALAQPDGTDSVMNEMNEGKPPSSSAEFMVLVFSSSPDYLKNRTEAPAIDIEALFS